MFFFFFGVYLDIASFDGRFTDIYKVKYHFSKVMRTILRLVLPPKSYFYSSIGKQYVVKENLNFFLPFLAEK